VAGQPAHFNGAIGVFKITGHAEPTTLEAEEALTFTLRIVATGRVSVPPRRPDLRQFPEFRKRFHIDDLDEVAPSADGVWLFRYRLKPLSEQVTAIPALRFDYYKPGLAAREKGYRATYSPTIPLTVRPRAPIDPAELGGSASFQAIPDSIFQFASAAEVLRRPAPLVAPGPVLVVLLVLLPPLVCAGWCRVWRYRHPDAAWRARQRQSLPVRSALRALRLAERADAVDGARRAALVVTKYFRERLGWAGAQPTPDEAADFLERGGYGSELSACAAAFFRACDAVRFAPAAAPAAELTALAEELILRLEDSPWAQRLS
jgi:hypothetical protein